MKDILISVGFGLFWAAFMVWWSADYSPVNIGIFIVMGLVLGFAWTWLMKRWGYFK